MRILAIGLATALAATAAWSQIGGIGGNGTMGGTGRGGARNNPNLGSLGDPTSTAQRPVFVTGKVVLNDGAALPEPARIERVCGNGARLETYTDSKGHFSFEVGRSQELPDASGGADSANGGFGAPARSRDRTPLFGCDLRVVLPGFRSETVPLTGARYLDNPDLGTIILSRIANVEGLTISATSSLAPKDARKAFEKGLEAVSKKNPAEARKDFEKAAELYPRYAAAWYEVGRLDEEANRYDDARKSYGQALVADAKYLPPHERLAWIALRDSKWQELAEGTDVILRLDPIDYPDAYYLSGVANLQLGNLDAAEKSAREAVARDKVHKNARASYVLGLILARKQQYAAAAPLLRVFLEQNSDVSDAGVVREQLAAIEQAAREQAAPNSEAAGQAAPAKP